MARNFMELLKAKWAEGKFVCVGLDTDWEKLPPSVFKETTPERMVEFNMRIIDATKDIVCAFKPNIAFYEDQGTPGLQGLETTMEYLRDTAPDVPIILDAKRADIGNTNRGYVRYAFDILEADAVTVNPYFGGEALKPFLNRKEKGIIVLCKTSNPGAGEFQDLEIVTSVCSPTPLCKYLYQIVAEHVSQEWNTNGNCCIVVGATKPNDIKRARKAAGDIPILFPGIGTQGGDLDTVVRDGRDSRGTGMIINSSSSIIFASSGADFADVARTETLKLHADITQKLRAAA